MPRSSNKCGGTRMGAKNRHGWLKHPCRTPGRVGWDGCGAMALDLDGSPQAESRPGRVSPSSVVGGPETAAAFRCRELLRGNRGWSRRSSTWLAKRR